MPDSRTIMAVRKKSDTPPKAVGLAIFCDFDGTFLVQDVGSTLVKRYAANLRPALWSRWERGEITAWFYNMQIINGLRIPSSDLEEFLHSVEFDTGAEALLEWCAARKVPFRILSDGFDWNLDRLQEIHGIRFDYDANHLWFENGEFRISAGHENPACSCGTGTCKRGRIEAYRREHRDVTIVHIGNGRVSDLCGAEAADLVFAKDSLATELTDRGIPFERFHTLNDVVARLEQLFGDQSNGS